MAYSRFYKLIAFTATVMCSGCGDTQKSEMITVPPDSDYQISVTSDLETSDRVKAVTFVPNSAASWLGAVVLLTEDGALYRTNGQSSKPVKISDGPYKDVFGFARQAQPGVFLALENNGSLDAFIEIDDAGNFDPIPLSFGGSPIAQFCTDSIPKDTNLWAITETSTKKLAVTIQENKAVELIENDIITLPKGTQPVACATNTSDEVWVLTDKGLFKHAEQNWQQSPYPASAQNLVVLPGNDVLLSSQSPYAHILLTDERNTQAISLSDGLSIRGIDAVSYVTVTNANLGSTFSDGVLIAVDGENQRLVMVARDYFLSEIKVTE